MAIANDASLDILIFLYSLSRTTIPEVSARNTHPTDTCQGGYKTKTKPDKANPRIILNAIRKYLLSERKIVIADHYCPKTGFEEKIIVGILLVGLWLLRRNKKPTQKQRRIPKLWYDMRACSVN